MLRALTVPAIFCAQRVLGGKRWERWDPQQSKQASSTWERSSDCELKEIFSDCLFVFGRGPEGQPASFGSWIPGIVGILVLLKVSHGCCVVCQEEHCLHGGGVFA